MARPVISNTSVTIDAEGTPAFSRRIPSSTLPDEQDPQSPTPATTTSQVFRTSSMISACAGTLALCFRNIRAEAAPYSLTRMSPIFWRSLSELNLVFSMSAMRVRVLRLLPHELADLLLAPTAGGHRAHVLAGQDDHVLGLAHHVAGDAHVVGQRGEHAFRGVRELVVELVRCLGRHDRHRALLAPEAALDVQRRPRALRLVLGDDVGELAGMAERAAVERARA